MTATAPPRIKQILVAPQHGVPYLNTSQVFAPYPKPRKWLAAGRTGAYSSRLVHEGTILVMASATVGRAIVATKQHEDTIISHHFMRVAPNRREDAGWIYAFLRSHPGQAMMRSSQYASIIRHIEPAHLHTVPIPEVDDQLKEGFNHAFRKIIDLRNEAYDLTEQSQRIYESALSTDGAQEPEWAFRTRSSAFSRGRRRLEAAYYSPRARSIVDRFPRFDRLHEVSKGVWWGNRFKRIPSSHGHPYLSADDLFTTNPYQIERVVVADGGESEHLFVQPGWIAMACSGQTYGLNGSALILTEYHQDFLLSHDLIRIIPDTSKVRTGYLLTALTHPTLGRPLVLRESYGSSIPHIDPSDLAEVPIARLGNQVEHEIADLAERAAHSSAEADAMERDIVSRASDVVSAFLG